MQQGQILFVSHMFGRFGGLEIYNLDTVHAFQNHTNVQVISAFTSRQEIYERISMKGLLPTQPLLQRIYRRTWRFWLNLALNSLKKDVDLAVAGHVLVLPQVANYAKKQGIPYWLLVFGIDVWGNWSKEVAKAIEDCDRVVAISEYTAESVRRRLVRNKDRVVVIHPAVDLDKFFAGSNANGSVNNDPLIILTVGRLAASERYKGHDLIISALPEVQKQIKQRIEYWIIGGGDDRLWLEQLADEVGVADSVIFKGAVIESELIEAYQRCNVFAMPSYVTQRPDGNWTGEGFGIVYIEAAACGKPVIACDSGGQTDIVVNGLTGLLVKPTVDDVANALVELLSDPKKSQQMGEAGRHLVGEKFRRELFNQKWTNLLSQLEIY